jgi:hypothetical protein
VHLQSVKGDVHEVAEFSGSWPFAIQQQLVDDDMAERIATAQNGVPGEC